jgi:hypothetical protein
MLAPHAANQQALREALPTLLVLLHHDDATVRENAAASLTFVMRRCEPLHHHDNQTESVA